MENDLERVVDRSSVNTDIVVAFLQLGLDLDAIRHHLLAAASTDSEHNSESL